MTNGEYIALAAVSMNALVLVVGGLLVPRIKEMIVAEIAKTVAKINVDFETHKKEVDRALQGVSSSAMENNNVVKLELRDLKIWIQDTLLEYVRRDTFNLVMQETRAAVKGMGDDIIARLGRIENHMMGRE